MKNFPALLAISIIIILVAGVELFVAPGFVAALIGLVL